VIFRRVSVKNIPLSGKKSNEIYFDIKNSTFLFRRRQRLSNPPVGSKYNHLLILQRLAL